MCVLYIYGIKIRNLTNNDVNIILKSFMILKTGNYLKYKNFYIIKYCWNYIKNNNSFSAEIICNNDYCCYYIKLTYLNIKSHLNISLLDVFQKSGIL